MGKIVGLFLGSAGNIQALLIGAAVIVAVCLGLLTWGLYWRGEYRDLKSENVTLEAQGKIASDALERCNASADSAKEQGDKIVAATEGLLAEAQRLAAASSPGVRRIEELLKKQPPANADCRDAWRDIEKARQAK